MHLSGYYVLAPWSDVCIILRMLLQLVHVLVRTLAENVLRLGSLLPACGLLGQKLGDIWNTMCWLHSR